MESSSTIFDFHWETLKGAHVQTKAYLDQFLDVHLTDSARARSWHEVLHFHRPVRLFADCELKVEGAHEKVVVSSFVAELDSRVRQSLGALVPPNTPVAPPLLLDSSRQHVFSLHLIWPSVWCAGPLAARRVFEKVMAEFGGAPSGVTVDMEVYTRKPEGVPRTMRMPFCIKNGNREAGIMSPIVGGSRIWKFSSALFCSHLLTFHSGHSALNRGLPSPPTWVIPNPTEIPTKRLCMATDELPPEVREKAENTLAWLRLVEPGFSVRNNRVVPAEHGARWSCICEMYCPTAERRHKSNLIYMQCNNDGTIQVTCADTDCRKCTRTAWNEDEIWASRNPYKINANMVACALQANKS